MEVVALSAGARVRRAEQDPGLMRESLRQGALLAEMRQRVEKRRARQKEQIQARIERVLRAAEGVERQKEQMQARIVATPAPTPGSAVVPPPAPPPPPAPHPSMPPARTEQGGVTRAARRPPGGRPSPRCGCCRPSSPSTLTLAMD